MASMSTLQTPPGILAVVHMPPAVASDPLDDSWILFLDGVRDPGNLGTILRTADWFGYTAVLLGPGCVDWSNPKVIQASMGSIFRIRCLEMSLEQVRKHCPDHPLFAADMHGEDATRMAWPQKGILMMGNESHGLSPADATHPIHHVRIKKDPGSRAESLNVAMAAGILMQMISERRSMP